MVALGPTCGIERQQDFSGGECFPRLAERCRCPERQELRNDLSGDLFVGHSCISKVGTEKPGPRETDRAAFDRLASAITNAAHSESRWHESSQAKVSASLTAPGS